APLVEVREREPGVGTRVVDIDLERACEEPARVGVGRDGPASQTVEAAQPAVVDLEAGKWRPACNPETCLVHVAGDRPRNTSTDGVLDVVQLCGSGVVALGPELTFLRVLHELDGHAH